MTAIDRVEAALEAHGCRRQGNNYQCPAHDDTQPSLHLSSNSGGVALLCFAGCDTRDVVAALGLKMSDLFEQPREVARYRYFDGDGRSFDKVRTEPKNFYWSPALNGHKVGLYQIHEALSLPDPVYLLESEKDVDRLLERGVAATCMPGGAGSWSPEFSAALKGREVIIVADRDPAGVKHAMTVLPALGNARIVQSRTMSEHDDVGDHLDAGFTLEELVPFRPGNEISKLYVPINWHEAFKIITEEVDWLFPPLIEAGTVNVLFGLPGVGKSLLTLDIALQVIAEGKTVMAIDEENRVADLVERLRKFGKGPGDLDRLIVYSFQSLPALDTPEGGQHLLALAEVNEPALVILDTASRMLAGDENSSSTFMAFYRYSLVPLKGRGIASLRLDHAGKDPAKGQRGSSAKDGDADAVWRLKFQDRTDGGYLALEREKTRSGHGEEWVLIHRLENPLRHEFQELNRVPITPMIRRWARTFDEWGIPRDAGRPTLRAAIKEHQTDGQCGVDTTLLALVARFRKEQAVQDRADREKLDRRGWLGSGWHGSSEVMRSVGGPRGRVGVGGVGKGSQKAWVG